MIRQIAIISLVIAAASACRKQVPPEPEVVTSAEPAARELPRSLDAAVRKLQQNFQRVSFAFDSASLDETSKDALAANVKIMQAYPEIVVELQGHADERGTTDYNLGLGERRAQAVKRFMTFSGVSTSRLQVVSYGEERPVVTGSNPTAWSANRRVEFRILVPPQDAAVAGSTEF